MEALSRGAIVLVVVSGDYGKPRPAVVVQSNLFNETHASVTVCPITTTRVESPLFRITVHAGKQSGLKQGSQVMVDKIQSVRRDRIKKVVGRLNDSELSRIDESLRRWLTV